LATESALRQAIEREGFTIESRGARKAHAALTALGTAQSRSQKALESFGLTPVSRQAVDVRPPPDDDEFAEFERPPRFDFDR
jgi:phage terminase small subunit